MRARRLLAVASFCWGLQSLAGLEPSSAQESAEDQIWALQLPHALRSLLLDAAPVPGGILAVGDRGHVLVSEDGGESWIQSAVPTRTMLLPSWIASSRSADMPMDSVSRA